MSRNDLEMISFRSADGQVGFIRSDGSGETYPRFVPGFTHWGLCWQVFPDRECILVDASENYTLEANLQGRLTRRLWKYDVSTGAATELFSKGKPASQVVAMLLPDGEHLLCSVHRNNHYALFHTDLDGAAWKELSGDFIYGIAISPDGKKIAFHVTSKNEEKNDFMPAGYSINTMNVDGTDRRLIVGGKGHLYFGPAWSPDGEWLAYLDCHPDKDPAHFYADICIGKPDGSMHRVVTEGRPHLFAAAHGRKERRCGGSNMLQWSDARHILWTRLAPGSHPDAEYRAELGSHREFVYNPRMARGGGQLCLLDPFAEEITAITPYQDGRFDFRGKISPDGSRVAYTTAVVGGEGQIHICGIDGMNHMFLSNGADRLGADHPNWLTLSVSGDSPLLAGKPD